MPKPSLCIGLFLLSIEPSTSFPTRATRIECTLDSEFGDGLDITGGTVLGNRSIIKDHVVYNPGDYVERGQIKVGCACRVQSCVRKCCPVGVYMNGTRCNAPTTAQFRLPIETMGGDQLGPFHLLYGNKCKKPDAVRSLLYPEEIRLLPDGTLKLVTSSGETYFHTMDYCLDYIMDEQAIKALICAKDKDKTVVPTNIVGMVISLPFLLVTFLVYAAVLPERNLHGMCLMCFVTSLFWAYVLLVLIQLRVVKNDEGCRTVGVLCLFFFLGSFFWMNVMSVDIYWTFGGLRGFAAAARQMERNKFRLYSAYAWGVPLVLVTAVSVMIFGGRTSPDAWYHPGIGEGQCWLKQGYPTLLYMNGPMALLITVNVVLFAATALKLRRIRQETSVLRTDDSRRHGYEHDRQRFHLYVKLLLVMGINWSMEVISWVVGWRVRRVPGAIWYLTDFCNAIYGLLIFFIFVFKRNVWTALKKRFEHVLSKIRLFRSSNASSQSTIESSDGQHRNNIELKHNRQSTDEC